MMIVIAFLVGAFLLVAYTKYLDLKADREFTKAMLRVRRRDLDGR